MNYWPNLLDFESGNFSMLTCQNLSNSARAASGSQDGPGQVGMPASPPTPPPPAPHLGSQSHCELLSLAVSGEAFWTL